MPISEKRRSYIIPSAYSAVLIMILLAIWNPGIPLGSGPVDLLLLLDESDSITPEYNNSVWQTFLQQRKALPAGSRISLIRFADRAKVEIPWSSAQLFVQENRGIAGPNNPPPRHRFLDRGTSSLTLALKSAIEHSSPDRHTAILISSDGINNVTPAQSTFSITNKNSNLLLFYLKAENRYQKSVLSIESVNLPSGFISSHSLALSIAIKSTAGGQGSIETVLNNHVTSKHHLNLQAGEFKVLNLELITDKAQKQTIEFIIRDLHGNKIDQQKHIVTQLDAKKLLYIGHNSFTAHKHHLEQEGWNVIHMQPHELSTDEAFFNNMNVILMDNLKASALSPLITKNLINAVQQSATGLIVLGGSDSFGNGNYRHSELEKILPVTAEASRPLPAAAFLFLVDKSGSMDVANRTDSRLADALRAVKESAKSLRPGDESALLVFDKSVEVLLPLKHRVDTSSALNQSWQLQASGGTQLTPALKQAINILTKSDAKKRFLILVTDGFVDSKKMPALKARLQQTEIQLIALAIGSNADIAVLKELTAINNGRVLRVNKTAELPRLMRQELETKQQSWNKHSVTPITVNQPPFISKQAGSWHTIQGYQLSRAKSSASVYVTTNKGDPLLAVQHYGAGHVAALPGGILDSLSGEDFLSQLVTWLNSHQQNPGLNVTHHYLSEKLTLYVDAVGSDQQWHPATTAEIILTYPGGINHSQSLQAVAPGRFSAVMDAPVSGFYSAKITVADQQTVFDIYLAGNREHKYHTIVPWLEHALANKDIRYWDKSSINDLLHNSSGQLATRTLWLMLALFSFLAIIAFERSAGLQTYIQIILKSKFISGLFIPESGRNFHE